MAKKGGVQQLQSEINNDEEFEKFLSKDGVLVMDVYTGWCGPCIGMIGSLKKIKLEIGGDNLHLAVCKSDEITALKRFRHKSEPTWIIASHGKVLNLMFGTNVPKLMRIIIEELEMEQKYRAGEVERKHYEIDELTPEEQERDDAKRAVEEATARIEKDAIETKRKNYIAHVTDEIMTNAPDMGVTLFLPHLQMKESQNMNKKITECADKCELICKEKKTIQLSPDVLEILYFECLNPLSGQILQQLYEKDTLACVWKLADTDIRPTEEVIGKFVKMIAEPTTIPAEESSDDAETTVPPLLANFEIQVKATRSSAVSIMVTDESAVPDTPEADRSENQGTEETAEAEEEVVTISIPGVWTPVNKRANAALIYLYFRPLTEHFLPPDPVTEPPHLCVIFDAYKFRDIFEICDKYPEQILATGFFTTPEPGKCELIAKTLDKYQAKKPTVQDKLVIKVSKATSHCALALASMGPCYISQNTVVGKLECEGYFPENYNAVEVVQVAVQKKKKKKRGSKKSDTVSITTSEGGISDGVSMAGAGEEQGLEGISEANENEGDGDEPEEEDNNAANDHHSPDSLGDTSPTEPITAVESN